MRLRRRRWWGLACCTVLLLVIDIGGWGRGVPGARLGFGPVLSLTVWLVLACAPSRAAWCRCRRAPRGWAGGCAGGGAGGGVPGRGAAHRRALAPVHLRWAWARMACSVRRCCTPVMLDAAERRCVPAAPGRMAPAACHAFGMPLLQLERLTFRFVEAGFVRAHRHAGAGFHHHGAVALERPQGGVLVAGLVCVCRPAASGGALAWLARPPRHALAVRRRGAAAAGLRVRASCSKCCSAARCRPGRLPCSSCC
jgi:hypothetical protein